MAERSFKEMAEAAEDECADLERLKSLTRRIKALEASWIDQHIFVQHVAEPMRKVDDAERQLHDIEDRLSALRKQHASLRAHQARDSLSRFE